VSIHVGGDLLLQNEGKTRSVPMSVEARLDYDECLTAERQTAKQCRRSYRYYDVAEATIKLEKGQEKPALRDARRLIAAQIGDSTTTLFSPVGPLTREELDLIDVPANSLVLDDLLPPNAVSLGESWKHNEETIAALLGLEVVSLVEAESVLGEVTEAGIAKIAMAGTARGAIGGVSTELEFKAKYEVQEGHVDLFALLIKEKRSVGHVSPGLDVVAKVVMQISPLSKSDHLAPEDLAKLPTEPSEELNRLVFEPKDAAYQLQYDRQWFVTTEDRELAVLRLMDRGELIAQCNISPLGNPAPQGNPASAGSLKPTTNATNNKSGKSITLEDFQREVQNALGKKFGQFVQASEAGRSSQGGHLYRVVVQGEQADLPIRWIYYLIVGPQGNRVSLAFTLEDNLTDRFGSADTVLVAKLRLANGSLSNDPSQEARRPR
jgi:hypothetical protein